MIQQADLDPRRVARQVHAALAEETKKAFSVKKKVKVHVPEAYTDEAGQVYDFQTVIDSDTFVQLTMDLVQRSFKVCDEAMQSAPLDGKAPDGAWRHSAESHGDGEGWSTSPWMSRSGRRRASASAVRSVAS